MNGPDVSRDFFIFTKNKTMENQDQTIISSEVVAEQKRPQFLTILCVLSFICVGLMIIMTLFGILMNTPEKRAEQIEQMRQISPAQADKLEQVYEQQENSTMAKIQPYLTILFQVISLLGVIQMFNLKRIGFYIYAAVELLPYSLLLFAGDGMSLEMGGLGKGAAMAIMTVLVLFDLTFVVLYGLNLKHLKK